MFTKTAAAIEHSFFFFISLLTLFVYDFQTVDVVFVYRKRIYWKKA